MKRISIRTIENRDAEAVLNIYDHYVQNTIISFEYETPSLEEYSQRIKTNTALYPWLVFEIDGQIAGYAYGSTHRYRTAYQWSPESTIYVSPDFHRKGIARILYETLFALLKLQGYVNVFAGVGLPNDKSIGFHRALGFEEIGIFKKIGFKHGNWHDTHWFQLQINDHALPPALPLRTEDIVHTEAYIAVLQSANEQAQQLNL